VKTHGVIILVNLKRGYKAVLQLTHEEMKEYGQYFKSMRESVGLSKEQMAKELGVFFTTVHRWEIGQRVPKRDIEEIVEDYRKIIRKYKKETIQ
jgi:DNA-binding transcriptional regulator YiaG